MKIFISILYKHYIINSTILYMDSLWKPNIIGGFSNLVSGTAYTSYFCSMQRMTWNSHGIILGHWAWPTKYREFDLDCQQSPPPHIKTSPRNHGSVGGFHIYLGPSDRMGLIGRNTRKNQDEPSLFSASCCAILASTVQFPWALWSWTRNLQAYSYEWSYPCNPIDFPIRFQSIRI